jgi:hypothetical protein
MPSAAFQITGGLTQALGGRLRARANADADIAAEQLYRQNIYRATRARARAQRQRHRQLESVRGERHHADHDVFYPDGSCDLRRGSRGSRSTVPSGASAKSLFYFGMAGAECAYDAAQLVNNAGDLHAGPGSHAHRLQSRPRIPFTRWPF